ncbi:MAG: hypothetical protein M3406_08530 [Chloroflexota bacterium]|nr:hypothetical protein [Chloroflexota bacterium]
MLRRVVGGVEQQDPRVEHPAVGPQVVTEEFDKDGVLGPHGGRVTILRPPPSRGVSQEVARAGSLVGHPIIAIKERRSGLA